MLFLALDQSTSATKALLFDAKGRALDREARGHEQHYPQPGWVEHDAEEIWQNTLKVLHTLVARHAARVAEIVSLSLTNQRETIVVFERGTGRPLRRAIVWQCRRGDSLCDDHSAAGHDSLVHRKTGLKIDAYFSASKLEWIAHHEPDLHTRLVEGSALVGTIDTYLIYRLTQGQVFATDSTNASRTLLFDITRLAWDDELCALWNVPRHALPEVRDSSASFGETTVQGLLARPLEIRGVMGDSQASLFAQRCDEPGMAKVTFGTGSSLLLNIGPQPRFSQQGILTALAWTHAGVATYAFEGIIISSASTLTWLCDRLGLANDVAALEKLAQEVADAGGVHLVPAFTGLGLPYWQPKARAAIVGLSHFSDRRHVARAAFESIAYQIRDALHALSSEAGLSLNALHADGGPTVSKFLMQLTADIAGIELHVAMMADCSALGAVLAAQQGDSTPSMMRERPGHDFSSIVYQSCLPPDRAIQLASGWDEAVRKIVLI